MVPRREELSTVSAQVTEQLWQDKAACRGPQSAVFFPPSHFERKDEKEVREARAKAICSTCSVKQPCLDFAIRIREPHGIWGGLNELERRRLARKRAAGSEQRTA
jgi:WhiB family transcriptional regulator, redox-sensing transcriptional regulator